MIPYGDCLHYKLSTVKRIQGLLPFFPFYSSGIVYCKARLMEFTVWLLYGEENPLLFKHRIVEMQGAVNGNVHVSIFYERPRKVILPVTGKKVHCTWTLMLNGYNVNTHVESMCQRKCPMLLGGAYLLKTLIWTEPQTLNGNSMWQYRTFSAQELNTGGYLLWFEHAIMENLQAYLCINLSVDIRLPISFC